MPAVDKKDSELNVNHTPALTDLVRFVSNPATTPASEVMTIQDMRGGYVLQAACAAFNPSDNTAYYFGSEPSAAPYTTAIGPILIIPRAGIITYISLVMKVTGTTPTSETSTIYYRHQNTTDTTISSAVALNTGLYTTAASVSIAVAAGEFGEIKWATPAGGWATNPTGVLISVGLYIT